MASSSEAKRQRMNDKSFSNEVGFSMLCQKQWRINNASPLYNLQYSAVKLKQYAAKIRQMLTMVATTNSCIFSVEIKSSDELRLLPENPKALVLSVGTKVTSEAGEVEKNDVYTSILMSWGTHTHVPHTVHLPYYLERGDSRLGYTVKCALSKIFDCQIYPQTFTTKHVLFFGFYLIDLFHKEQDGQTQIRFVLNKKNIEQKTSLKLKIGDIWQTWKWHQEREISKLHQILLTYRTLQKQILYAFQLDIRSFDIVEVSLLKAQLKSSGMVKLKTPETVELLLTMLDEISRENQLF